MDASNSMRGQTNALEDSAHGHGIPAEKSKRVTMHQDIYGLKDPRAV